MGHGHGQHGHTHGHGHGHDHGHGHSHDPSPYREECSSPAQAAIWSFLAAFVGALAAVSLPTHVAGYFLPAISQTALLYGTIAFGAAYASVCTASFFHIMEESVSDGYRAPRFEILARNDSRRAEWERIEKAWAMRMKLLRRLNWSAAGLLVAGTALSVALFALGLRFTVSTWNEWCIDNSVIVVENGEGEFDRAAAVRKICSEMHLNQTYLVLGVPGLLCAIEVVRFMKTRAFLRVAHDRSTRLLEPLEMPRASTSLDGAEITRTVMAPTAARELGREKRRRHRYSRARSRGSRTSSEEDTLLDDGY